MAGRTVFAGLAGCSTSPNRANIDIIKSIRRGCILADREWLKGTGIGILSVRASIGVAGRLGENNRGIAATDKIGSSGSD